MLVAQLYHYFDEPEQAIKIAYQARILGNNVPEIHLNYLYLFGQVEDELHDLFVVDTVQPETAVLLADNQEFWVTVSTNLDKHNKWNFVPESNEGKLLIGHKVGDIVNFQTTDFGKREFRIRGIQSLYVRGYQETFEEFGTQFPTHKGLQKIDIIDDDFSKLIIPLYRRSAYADYLYGQYKIGNIPLYLYANLLFISPINLYTTLQVVKGYRVFASLGTAEDQREQKEGLDSTKYVTLDLTGLLSLSYLGKLPVLRERFEHIYISQLLIDEIEKNIIERRFELRKGASYLGYHDELPYFEEVSPKITEQNIKYLSELKDFLSMNCEIVPIPAELAGKIQLPADIVESVGLLAVSTWMVAKHTGSSLYIDDAVCRNLAKSIGVRSFSTQIFLENVTSAYDEYANTCAKLLEASYHYISVKSVLILTIIKSSNYSSSDVKVNSILKGIRGPETVEADAIKVSYRNH